MIPGTRTGRLGGGNASYVSRAGGEGEIGGVLRGVGDYLLRMKLKS